MKKIFIVLLILITGFSLFAIDSMVTFGYQQKRTINHFHSPFYVSVDLWQDLGEFTLYGNYKREMSFGNLNWEFCPNQDYCTIGLSYDFQVFEMRIEHMKQNPVINNNNDEGFYGSYTTLELRIGNY